MRTALLSSLIAAGAILIGGCAKENHSQQGTVELVKAFPGLDATDHTGTRADFRPYVRTAIAAARTNNYAVAVVSLEKALAVPGMTPDQIMAIQSVKKAWKNDLMLRASRGDKNAEAALAAIAASH